MRTPRWWRRSFHQATVGDFCFFDVFWVFLMNLLVAQKLILQIWCLSLRLFLGHGIGDFGSSYPFLCRGQFDWRMIVEPADSKRSFTNHFPI